MHLIQPIQSLEHTLEVPGSKSLTQRALILGALGEGLVRLDNVLDCEDTQVMMEALKALGFRLERSGQAVSVWGQGGRIPNAQAKLFLGNAGTALRFLAPLVCLHPAGCYHLEGTSALNQRPIAQLLEALERLGAQVTYLKQAGQLPCVLKTQSLRAGTWYVNREHSSQGVSGLLMAAAALRKPVQLNITGAEVSGPYEAMTVHMLRDWQAADITKITGGYSLTPKTPWAQQYFIEPDASSASYFLGLPLALGKGACVRLRGRPSSLQGDWAFLDILRALGLTVSIDASGIYVQNTGKLKPGITWDATSTPDIFMTLAALAPLIPGPTHITGIAHTRFKESNRPLAVAQALLRLGQSISLGPNSLRIFPAPLRSACIATLGDHRIAMSFAVLGAHRRWGLKPWLALDDPFVCGKSYPGFFKRAKGSQRPLGSHFR